MQLKLFFSLAALVSAITASSILQHRQDTFHLKTSEVANKNHSNLGLYLYHTGAGLNDAVLQPGDGDLFFTNGTQVQHSSDSITWGIYLGAETNYAGWEFVTIDGGSGTNGFFFNASGLQSNNTGFGGWLVCDWWHGAPQLFSIYLYEHFPWPTSCSQVNLLPNGSNSPNPGHSVVD